MAGEGNPHDQSGCAAARRAGFRSAKTTTKPLPIQLPRWCRAGRLEQQGRVKPTYFKSAEAFRAWLKTYHVNVTELWIGFYKKDSGKGGITYAKALDEALCFGWIDGIRKRVDELRFAQRFTPRKPTSVWSRINVGHVKRLTKSGRMKPAGLKAFAARSAAKTGVYSFENRPKEFSPALQRQFQSDRTAWEFFQQQPPGYRRLACFFVMSAKQEPTRQRRLARLIADSKQGRRMV